LSTYCISDVRHCVLVAAEKPAVIKKVLVPEEIGLKAIGGLLTLTGDIGEKVKESKRWVTCV